MRKGEEKMDTMTSAELNKFLELLASKVKNEAKTVEEAVEIVLKAQIKA